MGHGLIGMKMEKNGMKEPIGRGKKLVNGLNGTKMDKKNMKGATEIRRKMGNAARERAVRKFSWDSFTKELNKSLTDIQFN